MMTPPSIAVRIETVGSGLSARPGAALYAVLVAALSVACGGATTPGSKALATPPVEGISPLPRSVQVEQDAVVVAGRWVPIEAGPESPVVPNAVRFVCGRPERACKEDLTRLASEGGKDLVHEVLDYRVDEWTAWGRPAGKVVASRREGATQIEIRVSLNGATAEKLVIQKGRKTRWRIE